MKWTIICMKEGKPIGYWFPRTEGLYNSSSEIRKDTIMLYDDEKKLYAAFDNASKQIPSKYGEDIVPAIAVVSTNNDVANFKHSINRHLVNAEFWWAALDPQKMKEIKAAVELNLKAV